MTRKRVVRHPGAAWVAAVARGLARGRGLPHDAARAPSAPAAAPWRRAPSPRRSRAPAIRVGILPSRSSGSRSAPTPASSCAAAAAGETAVRRAHAAPRDASSPAAPGAGAPGRDGGRARARHASRPRPPPEILLARRDRLPGAARGAAGRGGAAHRRERGQPRGLPAGRRPERALARGLPADRGAQGPGGGGPHLRPRAPRATTPRRATTCAPPPACQVYRGQVLRAPADRPGGRRRRAGIVATWRGRPINAFYTSTCGGHTEDGAAIFDDDAPYLRGVACRPERSARHTVRTTAAPRRDLPGGPETARDVALLEALGVVDAGGGRARSGSPASRRTPRSGPGRRGCRRRCTARAAPARWRGALARRGTLRPSRRGRRSAGASGRSGCSAPGDAELPPAGRGRRAARRATASGRPWPCCVQEGLLSPVPGQHAAPRRGR